MILENKLGSIFIMSIIGELKALIKKGQKTGTMIFRKNGEETGRVDVIANEDVEKKSIIDIISDFILALTGAQK